MTFDSNKTQAKEAFTDGFKTRYSVRLTRRNWWRGFTKDAPASNLPD